MNQIVEKTYRENPSLERSERTERVIMLTFFDINRKRIARKTLPNQLIKSPIPIDTLEVVGYLCGDKIDKNKAVKFNLFDTIEFMNESINPIKKDRFFHYRCTLNGKESIVVAKLKND